MSLEKAASCVKEKENCGQRGGMINEELSKRFKREGPGAGSESFSRDKVGQTETYKKGESEKDIETDNI